MNTVKQWWAWYLCLPTWKQVLLVIPFILILVLIAAYEFGWSLSESVVGTPSTSRDQGDALLKKNKRETKALQKEAAKIAGEIAAIREETVERHEELQVTMGRIDSADGDELVRIAAELRAKHERLLAEIARRNSPDGGK
jgi:hypothetical protein